MINFKNADIYEIKNLELIYFYNIGSSSYIGLNIVYDGGKNLNYDYTYEYFDLYVARVVKVYENEKEDHNIQFLNQDSKEKLCSFLNKGITISDHHSDYETTSKYNSRDLDVKFLMEYIKRAITLFLRCMNNNDKLDITSIKGYRDKYLIEYVEKKSNFDQFDILPITLIKQDNNNYIFKFRYVYNSSMTFNGNITIYNDCISLNYISIDKNLVGKNIYHIDGTCSEVIKFCGNVISYGEHNDDIDNETIDFYLNFLDLPLIQRRLKTVDNNYLLVDNIDDNTSYFIHLSLSKDYVNVIVDKKVGILRDKLFVPFEEEKAIINIMKEENNLVVEKHYLKTPISTALYKNNLENKYIYETYKIDDADLTKAFNIDKEKQLIK